MCVPVCLCTRYWGWGFGGVCVCTRKDTGGGVLGGLRVCVNTHM